MIIIIIIIIVVVVVVVVVVVEVVVVVVVVVVLEVIVVVAANESCRTQSNPASARPRSLHVVVGFGCPRKSSCYGRQLASLTQPRTEKEKAPWKRQKRRWGRGRGGLLGWEIGSWSGVYELTHTRSNGRAATQAAHTTIFPPVHSHCESVPIHVSAAHRLWCGWLSRPCDCRLTEPRQRNQAMRKRGGEMRPRNTLHTWRIPRLITAT
ncbi:hypothetical protein ElyMa_001143800 [Elysia marginata]|uniref:Secreted protein n=1 Tax=Elysia marginata TaxID=1093978 RepID=A0AAV4HZ20_9GAST|nr:hypothetical protein ElyMa_001143800 [Elysia marginata]